MCPAKSCWYGAVGSVQFSTSVCWRGLVRGYYVRNHFWHTGLLSSHPLPNDRSQETVHVPVTHWHGSCSSHTLTRFATMPHSSTRSCDSWFFLCYHHCLPIVLYEYVWLMSLLGRADFKDGRFEILEASVPVPPGDVSLATVQRTRHGLDITVPLRHLRLNRVTPKTGDQKDQKDQKDQSVDQSVDQGVDQSGHGAHGVHRGQPDQNDAAMPRPKHWAESRATSEVPNESKVRKVERWWNYLDVALKVLAENMFSQFYSGIL